MSLPDHRCTARLVRPPLACLLALALTACVVLFLPTAASASVVTTASASICQRPLAVGNALFSAAIVPAPVFQAELTSSDAATYDNLGYAVALSGDTALVGDPYKTVGDQGHVGAVYVYTWSGTSWSQQAELTDPDAAGGDYFGASVALSGDTALVGAWGATVNGQGSAGKAYIFTRSGGSWTQQAVLNDPDTTYEDYFGTSVALAGDTALIGAPSTTVGGQNYAGVVYIYIGSGGSWTQQAVLHDPDAANGDNFGTSLALSGNTALVGDPNKTVGEESAGAAYVYTGSGASWTQEAELSASDASGADHFGASVALAGNTALIGAFDKTVAGQNYAGAAYIYGRSGASWTQQAELSDPDAASGDNFGSSVALAGNTALVGAPEKTVGGVLQCGAAYVYSHTGASWPQQAELSDPNAGDGDYFGSSVALYAYRDTALVGAWGKTANGVDGSGAAEVYALPDSDDSLSSLTVSAGSLSPSFAAGTLTYADSVANSVSAISLTPVTNESHASYVIQVGGVAVSNPIALSAGANVIDVVVTAQSGASETYSVTVTRAGSLSSPTLTLKLSGLTSGAMKHGKSLTAKGAVTPTSLAGGTVTLTVQRKQGSKWLTATSLTCTISPGGTYSRIYKPATKGSYRIMAAIAAAATNTAASTAWQTFTVK